MIDYSLFLNWAKSYFGEENIVFQKGGDEICVPSPFADDFKNHLWMNPSGGKSKHPENGSYRCWKSDRSGSLVSLVSELEGLDWDSAQELICDQVSLRMLEKKVHEIFGHKDENELIQSNIGLIELPVNTYLISSLRPGEFYEVKAREYLEDRKIPTKGLYVCVYGKYFDRIIIPYYDKNNNLIWWNARAIEDKPKIKKYMKPDVPKDSNLSQENVLFVKTWPKVGGKLFLMEGEFDAISLDLCGFRSAACGGKSLSQSQIELLRPYIPVLAFDNDSPGKKALIEIGLDLLKKGFSDIFYVRPPKQYKDWNEFLVKRNEEEIQKYINRCTKRFNVWSAEQLGFQGL